MPETKTEESSHVGSLRGAAAPTWSGPWVHGGEKLELTPPDKVPSRPHLQKIHGSQTMHPNIKR